LFAHGRWFSSGTLASSTTKTGHHDRAEILLKVALNTIDQINQILPKSTGNHNVIQSIIVEVTNNKWAARLAR
jgi:hypothetical protein